MISSIRLNLLMLIKFPWTFVG